VNMRLPLCLAFLGVAATGLGTAAQSSPVQQPKKPASSTPSASATPAAKDESAEGEKRFETNCGRCHVPPENLSPREARAVIRQMRVRANLTAEDERLILKYLAP
jgi:cytochrome c5